MTDTDLLATPVATSDADSSAGQARAHSSNDDSSSAEARRGGLAGMLLPQLRGLAAELGIKGTSGMRKGDLISAIKDRQGGGSSAPRTAAAPTTTPAPEAAVSAPAERTPDQNDKNDKNSAADTSSSSDNAADNDAADNDANRACLLYTSPSPRDGLLSRMPSSA